jgi:hypothetical protein
MQADAATSTTKAALKSEECFQITLSLLIQSHLIPTSRDPINQLIGNYMPNSLSGTGISNTKLMGHSRLYYAPVRFQEKQTFSFIQGSFLGAPQASVLVPVYTQQFETTHQADLVSLVANGAIQQYQIRIRCYEKGQSQLPQHLQSNMFECKRQGQTLWRDASRLSSPEPHVQLQLLMHLGADSGSGFPSGLTTKYRQASHDRHRASSRLMLLACSPI